MSAFFRRISAVPNTHAGAFGSVRTYGHATVAVPEEPLILQPLDTSKNWRAPSLSPDFWSWAACSSVATRTSTSSSSIACFASSSTLSGAPRRTEAGAFRIDHDFQRRRNGGTRSLLQTSDGLPGAGLHGTPPGTWELHPAHEGLWRDADGSRYIGSSLTRPVAAGV